MSAYQALYRKWRPMKFDDVVGQKHVSDTLRGSVESGRVAHAYLFCGTRGTGKTSAAKIFSRAVNCENPIGGEPCNECPTCRGILDGSITDVYEMDAASNNSVDNIRDIRAEVIYTPVSCAYKVYIIDEAHMLSKSSFNALLKTLEEPPSHAIFILATTEPNAIPATVHSRCQRFDFRRIGADDIAGRILHITEAEGIDITPDAAELVAELGDGSMRDAISILDRCASFGGQLTCETVSDIIGIVGTGHLFAIADAAANDDSKSAIITADGILKSGREAQDLLESLIEHFRALLLCKSTDEPAELIDKTTQAAAKYAAQSQKFSVERLLYSIKMLSEHLAQLRRTSNPRIAVETAMIKLSTPAYSADTDALLARIEKLEAVVSALTAGGTVQAQTPPPADKAAKGEELPPWDIDDKKPEPSPLAPQPASDATDNTTDSPKSVSGESWEYWADALNEIKKKSKTLFAFLYIANAALRGNVVEIEVGSRLAYDKIATPGGIEYLSNLFSQISGKALTTKIFIKGENSGDSAADAPSIKDLAAKKDMLGDKMDII